MLIVKSPWHSKVLIAKLRAYGKIALSFRAAYCMIALVFWIAGFNKNALAVRITCRKIAEKDPGYRAAEKGYRALFIFFLKKGPGLLSAA